MGRDEVRETVGRDFCLLGMQDMLRTYQAQASSVKKLGGKVKILFSGLLLEIATERFGVRGVMC